MTMQQDIYCNPAYPPGILTSSSIPAEVSQFSNNVNFCPPVSAAMYGTPTTSSWAHTVPTFMPWIPEGNSASSSDPVVRFTAPFPPDPCTSQTATSWELLNNLGASKTNANLHLKRRSEVEEPKILPHKLYISEEKMAARMQKLHISNQYTVPCKNSPFGPFTGESNKVQKPVKTIQELEKMLSSNDLDKTERPIKGSIVLAPEIKNLVEPEKLFAKTFVHEIERPTMAVVLWKPPQGSVKDIRNLSETSKTQTQAGDSQNNYVLPSSFLVEKNNNPSRSFPDLIKTSASSNLSTIFNPVVRSSQNTNEDFEMEA